MPFESNGMLHGVRGPEDQGRQVHRQSVRAAAAVAVRGGGTVFL
jgi:hypothetical protein